VVDTADTDTCQVADLGAVSGTIHLHVTGDNTPGQNSYDTLYVDHMFLDGRAPPTEPPEPASNPDPLRGATNVSTSPTLTWPPGGAAHESSLAQTHGPPASRAKSGTSFSPGPLALNTRSYWRIDKVHGIGTTAGAVWSFTTRRGAGPTSVHVDFIMPDPVRTNPPSSAGRTGSAQVICGMTPEGP
jgi:hypothetical protein